MKMILSVLLLAPQLPSAGAAEHHESTPAGTLKMQELLDAVRTNNPTLKAAAANWAAMKQRVPQARAWEDPMVGVDVERFGTTRFGSFTDNEWMIAQELPLTGKNRLRGKSAVAEAIVAFEELRRRELDVLTKARVGYYNLANAWEQLAINDRNLALLKQFVSVSRAKYETGAAPQSDVLAAETDLAKLQEARFDIVQNVSDAESRLNVLMNRPARAPLGRPEMPQFAAVEVAANRLEALALVRRPELLMGQKRIEAAEARHKLASRAWIPDPQIRLEARQFNGRSGIQEYDTGVFFNFPWVNFRKYKAAIEEARQMKLMAEHELEGAQKDALGLLREQMNKVETFRHHTELFRDKLVPLARQNMTATRSAYEANQVGFLNVIDAQRTFYEVESMYRHHLTTYLGAVAELEAVVGDELRAQPKATGTEKKETP